MGVRVPHPLAKNLCIPPTWKSPPSRVPPPKVNPPPTKQFSCYDPIKATIFILNSYTQVMQILILIDVQHLKNIVFSFEKGVNGQSHFSGSHHPMKKLPQQSSPLPFPQPLNAI